MLFAVESSPSDQLPTPRVLRSAIKIAGFVQHIRPTATFGFLRILGICNNAATEAPRAHAFDPVCVCRVLYNLENQALWKASLVEYGFAMASLPLSWEV